MIKKILISGLAAIIFGLSPAVDIVRAESSVTAKSFRSAASSRVQSRRFGPYATLQRANAVANYARRYGYKAQVIYAGSYIYGTRQYYVDVWR